jgi:hypothetical protein
MRRILGKYAEAGAALVFGAGVVAALVTSFGARAGAGAEPPRGGETINWSAPLAGAGIQVAPNEAASVLGFIPVDVSPLGTPDATFVTNPNLAPPEGRAVAWTFSDAKFGVFVVDEEVSQTSQAELEALAGVIRLRAVKVRGHSPS